MFDAEIIIRFGRHQGNDDVADPLFYSRKCPCLLFRIR